jgi:hypothetical protein
MGYTWSSITVSSFLGRFTISALSERVRRLIFGLGTSGVVGSSFVAVAVSFGEDFLRNPLNSFWGVKFNGLKLLNCGNEMVDA